MNKHCQSYMYAQVHDQIIKYIKTTIVPVPLHHFILYNYCRLVYLNILPYNYSNWLLR